MAVPQVRRVPGWERTFLQGIRNGYTEKTAANAAGIGSAAIRRQTENDPEFKRRYEEAWANRRERPAGGIF